MGRHSSNRKNFGRLKRSAFISLIFSLVGLYIVIYFTQGSESWRDIIRLKPSLLIMAAGLVALSWLFDCLRMVYLSGSLGASLNMAQGMHIAVIGAFISSITPFDSGGEPVQAYLLTQTGLTAGQSTAVVTAKTLCNGLARFTLGLAAYVWLLFFSDYGRMTEALYGLLLVGIAFYFVVFALSFYLILNPEKVKVIVVPLVRNRFTMRFFQPERLNAVLDRINTEIREFGTALEEFMENWRPTLGLVMIFSYGWWIAMALIPCLIIWGLDVPLSFLQVTAITLLFYLLSVYIPTPGSSGAAEVVFPLMFSGLVPQGLLGIITLIWRGFTYYLNLAAGAAVIAIDLVRKRKSSQSQCRFVPVFGAETRTKSATPATKPDLKQDFDTSVPNDLESPS